jgi:hypothetical protein
MDHTPLQKAVQATQAGLLITAWLVLIHLEFWKFDIDYGKYLLGFGFIWLWFYFVVGSVGRWRLKDRRQTPGQSL